MIEAIRRKITVVDDVIIEELQDGTQLVLGRRDGDKWLIGTGVQVRCEPIYNDEREVVGFKVV
jgi:hypothetical protein